MRSYLGRLIEVLYISRLRPNSGSKFASKLHKDDSNTRMDLHAATCCDGNLRPSCKDKKCEWHRYNAVGRLLPSRKPLTILLHGCSMSSKPVFCPGPHRLPLSSLMHGAAAKMNWLQESHNVRVNCHHLSCGLAGSFHRHTLSCTGGNGAILLRDEARYLDDVMSRLNCGYSRPRVHRLLSATSVQIASPAFCNCRP